MLRGMRSILFTATLSLAAFACGTDPSSPEETQLQSALETWDVHGPSDYSFTWQKSCFCDAGTTAPIRITVENGQITEAIYLETEAPVPASVRAQLTTIDGLFTTIEDAIVRDADSIVVSYDPNAGFPVSIAIDYEVNAADEELSIAVSDFRSNVARGEHGVSCGGAP